MRRQLLVSTATAAILSGLVFASAQEMPRGGGKQEGTMQNQGAQGGAQRGESRQQMPQRQKESPSTQGQRSQGEPERGKAKQQAQPKPDMNRNQTTGQGQREGERDRGQARQGQRDQGKAKQQAQPKPDQDRNRPQTTGRGQRDQGKSKQQAQPKPDQDRNRQQTTGQGQRDQGNAKQQAQPKTDQGRDQTTGQGRQQQDRQQQGRQENGDRTSVQGRTNLTTEQRTRIRETITSRSDAPRVDNVNFRISVGTTIPARVRLATVPREIVEIRPQFRNYQYVVVRDEILIVDNRRRIVEVIPAGSAGASGPAIRGGSRTDVAIDLSPDEIMEVQRVLVQRGFSVEVDGRLGARTRQALIQFQRREGLQATGRIDSRTVSSLGVSVRSNQGGGNQQPSTTGQGGSGKGNGGAMQRPSQQNQGSGQPQRGPSSGQREGNQSGGAQQGNHSPSPTTGQGGSRQEPSANQGSGAGQGGANNPPAKQAPSSGGATGGGNSMPNNQQQK
jgi:hypothetical protein